MSWSHRRREKGMRQVLLVKRGALLAAGVVALSAVIDAQAAIFVARRVLGRVETIRNSRRRRTEPATTRLR